MQTMPSRTTAYQRTFTHAPVRHGGAELEPLTPAERIALTIALLNRGLDLVDGFARTSLAGCTRAAFRGHQDPERERRPRRIT